MCGRTRAGSRRDRVVGRVAKVSLDMPVMVCGGAGFIGSHLVERLLAEGHAVDVVDDLSTGSLANLSDARSSGGDLRFHHLDVTALEFAELVGLRKPRVIYHLAVLPPGQRNSAMSCDRSWC